MYGESNPQLYVDPLGYDIALASHSSWTVTNVISTPREKSEDCNCGKATLKAILDASRRARVNIYTSKEIPDPKGGGGVGPVVLWKWESKKEECCCKEVGWKQFFGTDNKGKVDGAPPLTDAEGFALTGNVPSDCVDRPHTSGLGGVEYPADQSNTFHTEAICRGEGPMKGKILYAVDWDFKTVYKAGGGDGTIEVTINVKGKCM